MNEYGYYNGYLLDEPSCTYQLKDKEIQIIEIGQAIAEIIFQSEQHQESS